MGKGRKIERESGEKRVERERKRDRKGEDVEDVEKRKERQGGEHFLFMQISFVIKFSS